MPEHEILIRLDVVKKQIQQQQLQIQQLIDLNNSILQQLPGHNLITSYLPNEISLPIKDLFDFKKIEDQLQDNQHLKNALVILFNAIL